MNELKILYFYPDILELYGDHANIDILKYRIEKRNIKCIIDTYNLGDEEPNFNEYDIIFLAGGMDKDKYVLVEDLKKYKEKIELAVKQGVFFLLVGQGYEIFGKYYEDEKENKMECLNIFPYYVKEEKDKKYIGNVVIEVELEENKKVKVVGFENHKGQVMNLVSAFGTIIEGNQKEGFFIGNVLGTYIHGPLLSKNPEVSDYIIKYALERKYEEKINLKKLDDGFEEKCKEKLIKE